MIKTVWYNILINGLLAIYVCEMDVAMLFLMLASVTMMAVEEKEDNSRTMLSSCWR